MEDSDAVRDLMAKLMEAVEASLSGSTAVREALAELVKNGYEARLFFVANAQSARETDDQDGRDGDAETARAEWDGDDEDRPFVMREVGAVLDDGDAALELTKLDRDFLKSLNIRPENS